MQPQEIMASCDGARWHWYAEVTNSREMPGTPDAVDLAEIAEERAVVRSGDGSGPQALEVAYSVENYFGWPAFHGVFLDTAGRPLGLHVWNLLPDGEILDASTDSFSGSADIRIIRPGDADWSRYRREWTASYNPSHVASFPELAGATWDGVTDMAAMPVRPAAQPPLPQPPADPEPDDCTAPGLSRM